MKEQTKSPKVSPTDSAAISISGMLADGGSYQAVNSNSSTEEKIQQKWEKFKSLCLWNRRWKLSYYDDRCYEILMVDIHTTEVKNFIRYFEKRYPDTRHGEHRITIYKGLPIRLSRKDVYYNILLKLFPNVN